VIYFQLFSILPKQSAMLGRILLFLTTLPLFYGLMFSPWNIKISTFSNIFLKSYFLGHRGVPVCGRVQISDCPIFWEALSTIHLSQMDDEEGKSARSRYIVCTEEIPYQHQGDTMSARSKKISCSVQRGRSHGGNGVSPCRERPIPTLGMAYFRGESMPFS
jgi:hypothetical protein